MSRFATPSRSKPKTLAKSPPKPILREPGYRYGSGTPVKGASMKGRHYNDIRVDGQTRRSPSSPRSISPNSRISRDDITIESGVPPSTLKAFDRPQRNERKSRKDPLPVTSNRGTVSPTRINRDGFSVNAEVVSVGSESFSRSGRPKSTSSVQSRSNGFGSSDSQSVSGNSVLSTRSTLSRTTSAGATVSAVSTSSLHQPLSQSSPPPHGIHNIQLTQKAFRSVRKACVRDAISQFLESEEGFQYHQQTQHYLQTMNRSLSADSYDQQQTYYHNEQIMKKQQRLTKMTEVLRKSITDELNSYPPRIEQQIEDIFFPSENMYDATIVKVRSEIANILLDWKKNYLKETLTNLDQHFRKWEDARIKLDEIHSMYYQQQIPRFQTIIQEKQSKQQELLQLKRKAEEYGLNIDSLLSSFPTHWFEEDELKEDILEDIHGFDLNDFRKYVTSTTEGGRQSDLLDGVDDEVDENGLSPAAHRRAIEKVVNNSVFLSPHLLQVSKSNERNPTILGNEDSYYQNYFPSSNVSPNKTGGTTFPPPLDSGEIPSHLLAHSSYVSYMNTENELDEGNSQHQQETEESKARNSQKLPNGSKSAPTTPYQVSEKTAALMGDIATPSPSTSNGNNKVKINYNVIRVLGTPPAIVEEARPPLAASSTSYSELDFFIQAPKQPPYIPTPSSLQYSTIDALSPLTNQFANNVTMEDDTVLSSSTGNNNSSYFSGTQLSVQQQEEQLLKQKELQKRKGLQSKLLKKYSPKRDSIIIPKEEDR